MARIEKALFEDARLLFKNFSGKGSQYNREGDRNFCVRLTDEQAEKMKADGWKVKSRPPREEGDDWLHYIQVTVSFKVKAPEIILINSKGKTRLGEGEVDILDYAWAETIDLFISPYHWEVNGNTGVKAYLDKLYFTIVEDALDRKYADVPEASGSGAAEVSWEEEGEDAPF